MDIRCIHCSEIVDVTLTRCLACGGDPSVRGDADVVDLRDGDQRERENADLLASLVAAYAEGAPRERPRWGANTSTALEIELEPVRIGSHVGAGDVLPTSPTRTTRRTRRRA
jgi:hypothetical protein